MKRRCPQCWQEREWPEDFLGARGLPIRWCNGCRGRYGNWSSKTDEEKRELPRVGVPNIGELLATLYPKSANRKLGDIPSSITSRTTCPPSCSFYGNGCFAEYHVLASHWRRVGGHPSRRGKPGVTWDRFCGDVSRLPMGQLWRHNVAGDLPGDGDVIDAARLYKLVEAQAGRRGFTFTHKPVIGRARRGNRAAIAYAVARCFVVNLSADSLHQADALGALSLAPVSVVLPTELAHERNLRTPEGRMVTVCPAETSARLTCAQCQLCAVPNRKTIVGFIAHGQSAKLVSDIVRGRRPKERTAA